MKAFRNRISERSPMVASFLLLAALPAWSADVPADESKREFETKVKPFLEEHCHHCHGEKVAKAGLRLDELGTDFLAGKTADVWREVINAINAGEMPPEEVEVRPDPDRSFAVVEWVGRELKAAVQKANMAGGRILSRRLNREEYLNTVRDLLFLDDHFVETLREELPADGKAEGFDRLGSALYFDETQLAAYIRLAGRIAENAIVDSATPPVGKKATMEFVKLWVPPGRAARSFEVPGTIDPGPPTEEKTDVGIVYLRETGNGWGSKPGFGPFPGNVRHGNFINQDSVPKDGYYRIRAKAGAFAGELERPVRLLFTYMKDSPIQVQTEVEITAPLDKPDYVELILFLRKPPEGARPSIGTEWSNNPKVIIPNPEHFSFFIEWQNWVQKMERLVADKAPTSEVSAAKAKIEAARAALIAYEERPDAVLSIFNPKLDPAKTPRIHMVSLEMEGPIAKEWPPASHAALFPQGISTEPVELEAVFRKFLERAYRRPVTADDIRPVMEKVEQGQKKFAMNDVSALRYALQTVLCSPEFLLLFEPSEANAPKRPITDFELANRLSYFLWSSMPDAELFQLATAGKLKDPVVLQQQVRRLLARPKARAFANNFAGQWLRVRDYPSVKPDPQVYRDYDDALREAGAEEPLAFFAEVTGQNLSILNFLHSDFTMANERLAKFYGLPGVTGSHFRRVDLKPEQQRGGVLTMAGLLTFLADGTRTLPVRRGAWILEEMFNSPPPPPPPNAGEIQPNTQGQNLTVRQRLEKHRSEPTCASCHKKIDPLGLALENYDAIGAWRDRQNGERYSGSNSPPIDASGTLPGGRSFTTPWEFRQALLAEKERFVHAFTQKMLTYALGRPVNFIDDATVKGITDLTRKDDYRMQTLIFGVVTSEPFLTK